MSTYLNNAEFEAVSFRTLTAHGIGDGEARTIIGKRYPMVAAHLILEFAARGLAIGLEHIEGYMLSQTSQIGFDRRWKLDGQPFDPAEVWFGKHSAAALWEFAIKVGAPASFDEVTVEDLLASLRSVDIDSRVRAGCMLAQSIGGGLAISGEDILDVEHISGPAISDMLGRAMAGEAAAVDWLEANLVTEQPAKLRERSVN